MVITCSINGVNNIRNVHGEISGEHFGFEVLTAVSKNSTVFWDVTPCSPVEVH
jgi:hypothetical protein